MDEINELLIRSGAQDARAFQQLYQAASPRLYALCRRMMRDDALAEDVLQDSFVKIWKNARSFTASRGSAMTWMTTIVRNQALDRLRAAKTRPALEEEGDYESIEFASTDPGPESLQSLSEDTQQLLKCMNQLKPEQRDCILSAFYYGRTHDELAEKMKKPLGTVKAWIRRGMEQLRQCLSQAGTDSF